MTATLERTKMAKTRGRPPLERDDVTIKAERAIASQAKAVAKGRGVPVAEIVSEILRAPIAKQYAAMLRELEGKP